MEAAAHKMWIQARLCTSGVARETENGDASGACALNVRAGVEERLELYESSGRGRELLRAAHERRDIRHCTFSLGRIGGLVNDVRPRASDISNPECRGKTTIR